MWFNSIHSTNIKHKKIKVMKQFRITRLSNSIVVVSAKYRDTITIASSDNKQIIQVLQNNVHESTKAIENAIKELKKCIIATYLLNHN